MRYQCLVPAAGLAQRFCQQQKKTPKQWHRIDGANVLSWTCAQLVQTNLFDSITIAVHPNYLAEVQKSVEITNNDISPQKSRLRFTAGGETRQESIHNLLQDFSHFSPQTWIWIHDAARPCIAQEDLLALHDKLTKTKAQAVTLVQEMTDSVHKVFQGQITTPLDRNTVVRALTPQIFRLANLLELTKHKYTQTDEVALFRNHDLQVEYVVAVNPGPKLTNYNELPFVTQWLRSFASPPPSDLFSLPHF